MAQRKVYFATNRKRPKFTPVLALDQTLYAAMEFIKAHEWTYVAKGWQGNTIELEDPYCFVCDSHKSRGHKPRCKVRDLKWNIENQMKSI